LKPGSTRTTTQKKKISNKKRLTSEKTSLNRPRNLASELAQERQEKQTKEDKIKTIYEKLYACYNVQILFIIFKYIFIFK